MTIKASEKPGRERDHVGPRAVDPHGCTAILTARVAPASPPPAARRGRPSLAAGARLANYTILAPLGSGGMGDVYAARDEILHREVALKITVPKSDAHADRLLDEARMMAKVIDKRVVTVYSADRAGNIVYVAMELVRGCTLRRWVTAEARAVDDTIEMFLEAGRGLASAHAAGMIHRDFKPANVLVSVDGKVKVADFGVALAHQHLCRSSPNATRPTGTDRAGTPVFMALEQLEGRAVDARADQYGFAASLFWALFRRYPHAARGTYAELAKNVAAGPPAAPNSEVPAEVYAVLRRALAPDPDDRFATLTDCLHALSAAMTHCKSPRAVAERAIRAVWNDAVRRAITSSLHARKQLWAVDVASRTCSVLDDYATAWIDARIAEIESSPADHAAHTPGPQLEQALMDFGAVVQALRQPCTNELLSCAVPMVHSLPPLARGANPPLSHVWGAAVADRYRELARARAASHAGRLGDAIATSIAVAESATAVPAVEAEARLLASRCLMQTGEPVRADAELTRALAAAAHAGDDATLAKAWAQRAHVTACQGQPLEVAATYAEVALVAALRSQDPLAQARVDNDVSTVRYACGDLDGAIELSRRAQARTRDALGPDHPAVWLSQISLANVMAERGEIGEATTMTLDAIDALEQALGFEHPVVLGHLVSVAQWAIKARNLPLAEALLMRLHRGLERHGWHNSDTKTWRDAFVREARRVVAQSTGTSVRLVAALRDVHADDAPTGDYKRGYGRSKSRPSQGSPTPRRAQARSPLLASHSQSP